MIVQYLHSIIIIILAAIEPHGNEEKAPGVLGAGRALIDHLNSRFIDEKTKPQSGTGFTKLTQRGYDVVQGPSSL